MRIDQLLVQRRLAGTRSQAQRLIAGGVAWLHGQTWQRVAKNGDEVPDDVQVRLLNDSEARFVSRGGIKLEAALKQTGWSVAGCNCLDVGQSTGGFSDCLLQHGALLVVGVDVGSAQLHPSLRQHPRVLCLEKINARTLHADTLAQAYTDWRSTPAAAVDLPSVLPPEFELIVVDLSFISQTLVLPALVPLLKNGGSLLTLVKPQFELQPGQIGKNGIVKDRALYAVVEQRLRDACAALGLSVHAWFDSPIVGGDGNHEFLIAARK